MIKKIWINLKHVYLKMLSIIIPMYSPMQGMDPLQHGSLGKLSMQIEELTANQDLLIEQVDRIFRKVKVMREGIRYAGKD